jgi:hypothetical protein
VIGMGGQPVPFHMGQQLLFDSKARIVAIVAGSQAGKTSLEPWWLKDEIDRHGAGDYMAVTASYQLFNQKFLPEFLKVFEDTLQIGRYWAGPHIIEIKDPVSRQFLAKKVTDPMWARVLMGSAQGKGTLESATAWAAVEDEAGLDDFSLKAHKAILRRLHLHQGRIFLGTTLYNLGWVKTQIIDPAMKGGVVQCHELGAATLEYTHNARAGIDLIQFDSIINPAFSIEEYELARARMPADEFDMMYRGRVAKLRSLVFDCFDPSIHVRPAFDPPREWPRIVGIDPMGQRTAALWAAWDEKAEQLHLYREYYEPFGLTTNEHVRNILRLSAGERILVYVGGGPSERQARADWLSAGIYMQAPPITDVNAQLQRFYALIKEGAVVVHDCCENLIDEMGRYQYKRGKDGQLTQDIQDKELSHLIDSSRYIMSWLVQDSPTERRYSYEPVQIGRGL